MSVQLAASQPGISPAPPALPALPARSYGHLSYSAANMELRLPAEWRVTDLAPHVAIAFKRLFPRVPAGASIFILSDTDEIRADLEWFMTRYPLAHDEAERLAEGARRIGARAAERDRILLPDWQPPAMAAFREGYAPYRYQAQAGRIAINMGSLLIGDDVGLGKTISAFAAIVMGAPRPAGIVVQAHLADQWAQQVRKFTDLSVHIIKGTKPYDLPPADIYVLRYSNIAGWVPVIAEGLIRTVIYDEIQELRHGGDTAKGRAAAKMSAMAKVRIGLTATPIYNYGDEMHAVMEFVQPELLGNRTEFLREWCSGTKIVKNPDALGSYLRDSGYFLRRTEDDDAVDAELPPPNVIDWEVGWDDAAAAGEEELMRTLAQTVLRGDFVEQGRAARELDLKLRMITGIAKARAVAAYVRMLLEDAEKVLVAGWHREVYDIWLRELGAFNPVLYTGSESSAGKEKAKAAFIGGDARLMFLSLRSGAGVDGLQHVCRDAVIGELDWSPQVHKQFIGRLRRPGQREQVTAHYLHTAYGSDPVLMEMLGLKSDQARGINDPGVEQKARFTDDSRIKRLAEYVLERGNVAA